MYTSKQAARRIGIMGGTFDPIHYGHLVTAEAARVKFDLEEVVFVPSGRPPHKQSSPGHAEQRLLMTTLATVSNPYFTVSRWEIDRAGYSYAYDTLLQFRERYGGQCALFFITGADAILEILTWRKAEKLIDLCTFIAATRPGYTVGDVAKLPPPFRDKIELLQIPALSISSTEIRARVKSGDTIKYLLPEAVEAYVIKMGLYQEADD